MVKPLKVGLIGSGKFAGHHSKVWQSIDKVQLIGTYSGNRGRCEVFAREHGIEPYAEIARLVEESDLIDVASTNDTHGDYALKAILAGCHIVIEKPLDIELKKAKDVCVAAHEKGVVATVVSNYRFNPYFHKMKQVLESGGIGEVLGGQITSISPRSEAYYSNNGGWRSDPGRVGGGVLLHQCIHHIDLLHWLFGEVTNVRGLSGNWTGGKRGIGVERTFLGVLEFESGIPVQVFFTTKGNVGVIEQQRIEVFGSRTVALSDGQFFSATGFPSFFRIFKSAAVRLGFRYKVESPAVQLRRQLLEVVSSILDGRSLSVTLEDGIRALKTVEDLYQSDRRLWAQHN